jgi:hypothetical protein
MAFIRRRISMTLFDHRARAFEAKFAHDEEMRFLAAVRRNKFLGLWAAAKLGLTPAAIEAYAQGLIEAMLHGSDEDDIFRKVRADFDTSGVQQSDYEIRGAMSRLSAKAAEQVRATHRRPRT